MKRFLTDHTRHGFTFIELLVATALLGVIATVAAVSYVSGSERTRDTRRKNDFAHLQVALEVYKQTNGQYPANSGGCTPVAYPTCANPWIPGMSATYIERMPTDPRHNITGAIANTSDETFTYNYVRLTPTTYHLITRLENDNDPDVNGGQYGYTGDNIYVVSEPK